MSLSLQEERQRLQRLQDDKFGPVTLHWRVASMWGPSPQPANPPEETFASNADALARVSVLIKTEHFHNPFITDDNGTTIWTESELRQKCT
jgi:hypothetical protein